MLGRSEHTSFRRPYQCFSVKSKREGTAEEIVNEEPHRKCKLVGSGGGVRWRRRRIEKVEYPISKVF